MFAAQQAQIIGRLQAQLPGVVVLGSFDQIDFREAAAPDLAVHVRYQGFSVRAQREARAKLALVWEVAVLVRLGAVDATLAGQADQALSGIVAALIGWELSPGILAIELVSGSEPDLDETGAVRYPLVFEGPAIVAGA